MDLYEAFDLTLKDLNRWFKVAIMSCQICCRKWLVGLATLGWCPSYCGVNWPERITLMCSQVLGRHLRASFAKFSGEMKR
jgi:hypothetical protein